MRERRALDFPPFLEPLAITFHLRSARAPDPSAPAGLLQALICRGCGFLEWYTAKPEELPVGARHATREDGDA
jgi:hypothetical protein